MNQIIKSSLSQVVAMLVTKQFSAIEFITRGRRLNSTAIETAISEYGRTLITPPDGSFERADVVRVENSPLEKYSVRFRLWSLEEGESDLSIELTITQLPGQETQIELDDILVF
jgi:hypothetical protein